MSNIGIIIASHGYFAKEALASVEMIMGYAIDNIEVVSIIPGKDYDTALQEIQASYQALEKENGVLVLTDIYGGTPANIATYLALEHEDVTVFSGFNLPILLELMLQRNQPIETIVETIELTYAKGLTNITEKIRRSDTDGDQVDSY